MKSTVLLLLCISSALIAKSQTHSSAFRRHWYSDSLKQKQKVTDIPSLVSDTGIAPGNGDQMAVMPFRKENDLSDAAPVRVYNLKPDNMPVYKPKNEDAAMATGVQRRLTIVPMVPKKPSR